MRNLIVAAVFTFASVQALAGGKIIYTWGASNSSTSSQTYTYQYNVNGCDTGKHTFHSTKEYCEGLADDELNNGCATQFRCEAFDKRCLDLNLDVSCN